MGDLIESNTAILIAGWNGFGYSTKTWLGNLQQQPEQQSIQWTPGPDLETGRYWHASAVITEKTGDFVVVSGGYDGPGSEVDSVEILKVTSEPSETWKWETGTPLPKAI